MKKKKTGDDEMDDNDSSVVSGVGVDVSTNDDSPGTSGVNGVSQGGQNIDLSDYANMDINALNETDLPDKVIVTQVDDSVFDDEERKWQFEEMFKNIDGDASFCYLKSFRRAHVSFSTIAAAVRARVELDNVQFGAKKIKCYFAQAVPQPNLVTEPFLLPPKPVKQFLISPPPSPPEGWEPIVEHDPIVDYELLAALAGLAPGQAHEIHPASEEHPGIIVHICEDPEGFRDPTKPKIEQTRNPTAN